MASARPRSPRRHAAAAMLHEPVGHDRRSAHLLVQAQAALVGVDGQAVVALGEVDEAEVVPGLDGLSHLCPTSWLIFRMRWNKSTACA